MTRAAAAERAEVDARVRRPRLGFLGVGWIGRHRLEAVAASGVAEVAAVADPAAEGEVLGLEPLASLEELLERELDGVVIATPSALHAEQAIAALEHGLAVFCQKPLARTAGEAERVLAAARTADRLLGVDLSYRFTEAARRVRELVVSGALGEIFAAELVFHNAYGPDKPWFYDAALSGGGCLVDLGTHLVDLALWTLEWPEVRGAHGHVRSHRGHGVEDYAVAHFEAGGALVRVACSWHLPLGRDCAFEASFYGSDGSAAVTNVGGSFYDFRAEHRTHAGVTVVAEPPDDWGGRAAVDWARRLAAGERFDPDVEHVVTVARVLDEIYRGSA